jgi:hypothetical protein
VAIDARLQARALERRWNAHDVHRVIGMQLAPAQHHPLEEIQATLQR